MNTASIIKIAAASGALLIALAAPASALPKRGDARPQLRLVDAWDRTIQMSALGKKPLLLIYEDQDSAKQNQALKDELTRLAKSEHFRSSLTLLAIADVSGFDYWPARGWAKDTVKDESRKIGAPIYCDWTGSARSAFDARKGASNVVLYGRDGRVLFARAGAVPPAARVELIGLIQHEIGDG